MTDPMSTRSAGVALVTGGSRGLGRALVLDLLRREWRVITDGRDASSLEQLAADAGGTARLCTLAGDVADSHHRDALGRAVEEVGVLDVLVNNASVLGPSPQPNVASYPLDALHKVYEVNIFAPVALMQLVGPFLERSHGRIVNISSDAAVEPYDGWGGYGSSKAALDHITAIAAREMTQLRLYAFDPGDMATDLHQQAFPDDDISDRAAPESVVPALLRLLSEDLPSGRYRAADLLAGTP